MSGVEVLSLVANIFQVIGFAADTIRLCNDIYKGRAPDDNLGEHATTLQALSTGIESHYSAASNTQDKELEGIAKKCAIAARALEEEVRFATKHHAQGDLAATLKVAVKTLWRKNRSAKLEASLGRYQTAMESHLLSRVCKQSDAINAQQEKAFKNLNTSIQFFISQYAAGQKTLSGLIDSNMRLINQTTVKEARKIEVVVASHVSQEVSSAEQSITKLVTAKADATQAIAHNIMHHQTQGLSDRQRERFLSSLKFTAMNERRNNIKDSHHGTFMWLYNLSSDSDWEESEFSSSTHGSNAGERWDGFQEWLLSDSNIYWISGKPGSGKSTLPGNKMQNSLKGLFCTLLHQGLSRAPTALDDIFARSEAYGDKDHDTDWSVTELKSLCLATLLKYPSMHLLGRAR
ncbi:uncharacterized protein DNG_07141 [Cephalotrichum gorgonifer]|uniref:Fungal N-terminal domain-containing protein n=1 Tax=Cephalotrichum gorgonifer TaxID=2041049 RepID=A0AAE8SX44_9PEZI|nr:uncharacterized protein DNG_07141 [Cephalotrichum gorgonifer]